MIVDIKFREKRLFSDYVIYRNIKDYTITVIEDLVIIRFTKTEKGITRHYEFQYPKHNFAGISIRKTEDNI